MEYDDDITWSMMTCKIIFHRVKALCCCDPPEDGSTDRWLFSASSDGFIKLWKVSNQQVLSNTIYYVYIDL